MISDRCFSKTPRVSSKACSISLAQEASWPLCSISRMNLWWLAMWSLHSAICRSAWAKCSRSFSHRSLPQSSSASRFTAGAAHGLLPKAASSARFAFWRQLTSRLRYNHASIAKVSLLLTSTTCAVVATRADTCRTSNSIMSSLSVIFIAPVTSTSFFMVLLLLDYGMLVAYILILFFLSEIGSGGHPLPRKRDKVLYCFHQNNDHSKCGVAHTSLPIRPSKSTADWY